MLARHPQHPLVLSYAIHRKFAWDGLYQNFLSVANSLQKYSGYEIKDTMSKPTKADVIDFFGTAQTAAEFMGLTRQAVEAWKDGELDEKRFRLLLGSFARKGRRIPDGFRVAPLRQFT